MGMSPVGTPCAPVGRRGGRAIGRSPPSGRFPTATRLGATRPARMRTRGTPPRRPVALFEIPIRNHTEHGEAIYDPFAGSGTALIAAERLGRRCYAMELVPEHVQRIIDRWEAFTGQTAIKVAGS